MRRRPRQRRRERSASLSHEARASEDNEGGWLGAGGGAQGWGWGGVKPGRGLPAGASRSPTLGLGSGAALGQPLTGPGLKSWGPGWGAARALISPGARGSAGDAAPARAGLPAPAAAVGSVPHCPAPPPPAAAAAGHGAEPPRGAGRGRAAGQTQGPADRRTTEPPPPSRATAPRRGKPGRRVRARVTAAPASSEPARAARRSGACPRPSAAQLGDVEAQDLGGAPGNPSGSSKG